jgi:hypothetical protein
MPDTCSQLPNFFILGAQRAGTRSLHHYLGQHPCIFVSDPPDTLFFIKDDYFARGPDYYRRAYFHDAARYPWRGEASPQYFSRPEVVGPRLRQVCGDHPLKFVVMLRAPVARAWSHYLHRMAHGYEHACFATLLGQESVDPTTPRNGDAYYFADGLYARLLDAWQSFYPLSSFCLLLSEDLDRDPQHSVRKVFRFLGVDAEVPVDTSARLNRYTRTRSPAAVEWLNHPPLWARRLGRLLWPDPAVRNRMRGLLRNTTQGAPEPPPAIDPVLAAELRARYHDDVRRLGKLLGRDLSHWLADHSV